LQGHTYPIAVGLLPPDVPNPNRGPGVTVATTEFSHGNPGVVGGAMLANNFVPTPLTFWCLMLPPEVPRWGVANKRAMRDLYLRAVDVRAPVQEIPLRENRVSLHPQLRDGAGLPIAALSSRVHRRPPAPPTSSAHGSSTGSTRVARSARGRHRSSRAASPTGSTRQGRAG